MKPKVSLCKKILKKWDLIKEKESEIQDIESKIFMEERKLRDKEKKEEYSSKLWSSLSDHACVMKNDLGRYNYELALLMEEFREVVNKKEQKNEN